jgi:hypothetical protein
MRPMLLAIVTAISLPMVLPAQKAAMPRRQRRALLEAATSYSQPGDFYLVAASVTPYTVVGALPARESADSAARTRGAPYRVYGPYHGPARPDRWQVLSVSIRVRTEHGDTTVEYPRTVDAVFLTMSAVRKFLIPYYRATYGPQVADSLAQAIVTVPIPRPPCHALSMPCMGDSLLWMPVAH